MRVQAATCPRKLYYFLRNFDYPSDQRPAYFVWGAAWEEILATWYSAPDAIQDPKSAAYQTQAYLALQMGLEVWDEVNPVESKLNKRGSLEPIWNAYLETYPVEPWRLVERGAEAGWTYPLAGTPYYLGGALDGIVDYPGQGLLVLENKTDSGYLSEGYCASWHFSPQVTGYIWYVSQVLGFGACKGALLNLVTKNLPGPRSNWTTPRFKRVIVQKTRHELEQFERFAAFQITRFQKDHWNEWWWPQTLQKDLCTGGVGLSPCLFQKLCSAKLDPREVEVSDFPFLGERSEPWQPWLRSGAQS